MNQDMTLNALYAQHTGKTSDKWSIYLNIYDRILEPYKHSHIALLEIGVQNGGSLEIWSKYFKNATHLVGCDINPDCLKLEYEDTRISVVVGDANAESSQDAIKKHSEKYNIIIDDGSHQSSDIVKSFCYYFDLLCDGGVYVAEDLHCSYWQEFEGGLYDPFSSIAFFKALIDIINYESWGVVQTRADRLNHFVDNYGVQLNEDLLYQINSIEFIN